MPAYSVWRKNSPLAEQNARGYASPHHVFLCSIRANMPRYSGQCEPECTPCYIAARHLPAAFHTHRGQGKSLLDRAAQWPQVHFPAGQISEATSDQRDDADEDEAG